jgi:hypothetical protein
VELAALSVSAYEGIIAHRNWRENTKFVRKKKTPFFVIGIGDKTDPRGYHLKCCTGKKKAGCTLSGR